MASIRKKTKSDGSIVYVAQIVIKKHGVIAHRESKTFAKQKLAKDWGLKREAELHIEGIYKTTKPIPLGNIIKQYIEQFPARSRSKRLQLARLVTYPLMNIDIHALTVKDLIDHIKERLKTVKPQTAKLDMVWIKTATATIRAAESGTYDLSPIENAIKLMRKEHLIADSAYRERRPTREELWKLSRYLRPVHRHILWFAIYSCRRLNEILNLRWDDIDHEKRTILVRNLKHPKTANYSKRAKLPRSAYKVIMRQPKTDPRIFPHNTKYISEIFTEACVMCGIKNLHFHDLRHEGISRLFERKLSIVEVQQVSLHSTWKSLSRYTNLDAGDLDI